MYHNLIQIITAARLISRSQGAKIAELQERVGVSRRTVYRIIEALEELGYPVYQELDGRESRVKLNQEQEKFRWWLPLPKVALDFEDRVMLDYLLQQASGTPALADNVRKLRKKIAPLIAEGGYSIADNESASGKTIRKSPVILHDAPVSKLITDENKKYISMLLQAINEECVCLISYEAIYSGILKKYSIHPLSVFEHNGGVYAYVLVPYYNKVIILAIERFKSLELTEEGFKKPEGFNAEKRLSDPFGIMLSEPFIARIKFNQEQSRYIKERAWPEDTKIEEQEDGGIIITLETAGAFELKRWILGFGSAAELLEPEELRKEIALEFTKGSQLYS